ncbi:MAG: amidohydrolase family protein [Candidatus Heimdallarchaeota archaeon]|nr:amidohydrolase family protein [Candidatus Heimdallarchaeota archaeon]
MNAARAVKLEEDLGSLEVGKMGDLLIMTENALDNISVLEKITNIEPVVKSGKILVTNGKILQ